MKRTLLLALLCCPLLIFAQKYLDLAKFTYANTPQNNFEDGPGSTSIQEWQLRLQMPVPLNEQFVLLTGFTGISNRLQLDPASPGALNLYAFSTEIGLIQRFSTTWSATYMVIPKFASDFDESFSRGFQLAFLGLLTRTKSENLNYSFGLYTNTEEYGLQIVPLLGAYYLSKNNRLEINMLLPVLADIQYGLGEKTRLGMNFDGLGTSYAVNSQGFPNTYVNKSSNELFAYLQYALQPSLLLRLKLGYAFFRAFKVYDEADKISFSLSSIYFGDNRTVLNSGIEDGLIFKVALLYRLHF